MTLIRLDLTLPGGAVPSRAVVAVRLLAAADRAEALGFRTAVDEEVAGVQYFAPDAVGVVSMPLIPNAEIVPSGTRYEVRVTINGRAQQPVYIEVPASGTYDLYEVLDVPPADLETAGQVVFAQGIGLSEQATAPSAAQNRAILYAQDNGAGKTRLLVRFPDGSVVELGIQP